METKSFRGGLVPLLLIILIFFFRGFSRALFSPLLLDLEGTFSLTHTQSSKFFIYFSMGAFVTTLLSGFVSARLYHRGTIIASSLIQVFALLLIAVSPSVWVLHFGLIIMGCGSGLYPPSGMSAITGMLDKRDWQKALSLHEAGPHFAMALVPLFTIALLPLLTWRGIFAVTAGGFLVVTLIFTKFVDIGKERGEPPTFSNLIPLIKLPSFWILTLFLGFALGSIQGIYLLMPTFMISEAGFSSVHANTIFGISRFIPIGALLVATFIPNRVGVKRMMFVMMLLAGVSVMCLGLVSNSLLTMIIFIQPAFGAIAVPAGFSALSELGPKASRNVALSITIPIASFMGNGGIPAFVGFMADAVSFSAGFIIVGLIMVVLAFLSILIRLTSGGQKG